MKPIIITLLALPIVGFLHHTPHLSPKTKETLVSVASKQKTTKTTALVKKTPITPVSTPVVSAPVVTVPVIPQPIVITASYRCSSYSGLFEQYNWNVATAEAICQAESQGNPNAESPTDDYGLMQINHGYEIYGSAIYNPAFNIKIAYTVKYLSNGWLPWTTYTSGKYLEYL